MEDTKVELSQNELVTEDPKDVIEKPKVEYTEETKKDVEKKKKKPKGGKIGAAVGLATGSISTAMSYPLGRYVLLREQDNIGISIYDFFKGFTNNQTIARRAFDIYSVISNAILSYPAILTIAGGIIAAGVGALVGKKISKAKLKHQNMKQVKRDKTK